jgi:hypothetical protein
MADWEPIETAPKIPGTKIVISDGSHAAIGVYVLPFGWVVLRDDDLVIIYPKWIATHWMPLSPDAQSETEPR